MKFEIPIIITQYQQNQMNKQRSTYKFSHVEDTLYKFIQDDYKLEYLLGRKDFFNKENDTILINTNANFIVYPKLANGLLNTMMHAYNEHTPLTLRPDDLWITIVIVLMKFIDRNSNTNLDKKILKVDVNSNSLSDIEFWLEFTEKIRNEFKLDIANYTHPDFSTTRTKDKIIANIALMSGFKKMFECHGEMYCGLSEITLEGTAEDWLNLIAKTKLLFAKVIELNIGITLLQNWLELLVPVLEEFHNLYIGNVDEDFWQRICTHVPRGSGGDKNYRGWFLVFAPFNIDGEYILRSKEDVVKDNTYANDIEDNEIADTQIDTDVVICDTSGTEHDITLWAVVATTHNDNMLKVSSDFVAINHKHITYEMFRDEYLKRMRKTDDVVIHNSIIDFTYFIAIESNIPNNLLIKIANLMYNCISYQILSNIFGKAFDIITDKYYGFAKYVKPDQKEILIAKYENKSNIC